MKRSLLASESPFTAVVALAYALTTGCSSTSGPGEQTGGGGSGGSSDEPRAGAENGGEQRSAGGGHGGDTSPSGGGAGGAGDDAGVSDDEGSVYALVTHVRTNGEATGYVSLSNTLDVDAVSLDEAREFPGYTTISAVDGALLVNPGDADLTIERFQIGDDLSWEELGSISFANEGPDAVGFHKQYGRRGAEAFLDVDVVGRALWNPSELEVLGAGPAVDLPLVVDGLELYASFNRTYIRFDGDVVQPFSYHDPDWYFWSENSRIAVYDDVTREPRALLDAPCPGLDTITQDEAGNTYLSTQEYSALAPLIGIGAAPCVVRLAPDGELDRSWDMDLTGMTDGRHVVNFHYIGGGKAIGAVLHDEEFGADYDFTALADDVDEYWGTSGNFHRLWFFDLDAQTAVPVEGLDDFAFVSPWFSGSVVDGRAFFFLQEGGSGNPPTTLVYEVDQTGRASRRFEVPSGVIQWLKVR